MKRKSIYKQIALSLLLLVGMAGTAWGQDEDNGKETYSNVKITHKKFGVWYSETYKGTHSRNESGTTTDEWLKDTFDEKGDTTLTANSLTITIQKTHEYRDTIYMFPEETRELILPDIMDPSKGAIHLSLYNYQRWYDYTTDGYPEHIKVVDADNSRGGCGYKFANGLVGGTFLMENISGNAFDQGLYRVNFTMPLSPSSDGYIIACDASNYTDVTKPTSTTEGTEMEEPTLSQRAIFVILPATEIQSKLTTTTWFQDDTIHFPTKSVGKTDEQVALAMAARNYRTSNSDDTGLNCSITYPNTGNRDFLTLSDDSENIKGNTRKVSFTYNNESVTGPKDGDIAYIEVIKGSGESAYKIARFTLIFEEHTEALTQEEVKKAEEKKGDSELYFRTNAYLDSAYTLLTKLDLDYTNVTSDNSGFYPYPMNWKFGSYAFYTKASDSGVKYTNNPQWGEYAITSTFPFAGGSPALLPGSNYHLYVDANEYPGTICTVPFREELCPGASLYVTYWMMSTANQGIQCDASVIFVLKGIEEDGTKTVIHRQASGQIPYNREAAKTGDNRYTGAPLWNQLYFTFVNGVGDKKFVSYELEMQSNNANTNGADCIIDDIRVYMQSPNARVTQQKLSCGESTRLRMDLTWEQLLKRLGLKETAESNTENYIEFCFIDRDIYDAYVNSHPNETDRYDKAVEEATVVIGRDLNLTVGRLYYDLKYEDNTEYTTYDQSQDTNGEYGSLAKNSTKDETSGGTTKYFFYRSKDAGDEKQLSVDFYADMSQGRRYTMLIRDDEKMEFGYPEGHCAITTDFYVEGENVIKMNGELIGPDNRDYCKGQIFKFDVDMRYYSEETHDYESYDTEDIYYDWFFGSEMAYNGLSEDGQTTIDDTSLADALKALREIDKEATAEETIVNGETKYTLKTTATTLDDKYKTVIEKYLNIDMVASENGLHHQLVLKEKDLDIRIMEDGLKLVVTPIDTRVSEEDKKLQLCFEPIPFTLTASNVAPQIQPGFEYMEYENEDYNPAMRIGLQQIKDASGTDAKEITINLRNAKYALESYETDKQPTHIGLRWNTDENQKANNPIFLIDSDDPALDKIVHSSDFDRTRYIIGTVTELKATPYDNTTMPNNSMKITFKYGEAMDDSDKDSPKFEPKEGYKYEFMVLIEEHNQNHANENGACWGNFNLTMKVVPEYLVWKGTEYGDNWNNDTHWKRAQDSDIKAKGKIEDYSNDNRGYVPMLFSKVIIPKNGKVELYKAGFKGNEDSYKNMEWTTTIKDPELDHMEPPATVIEEADKKHPIQYDMMVYEAEDGSLSTKPYKPNLVKEIHFEPNAEMLHAELLTYDTAWVDYKLTKGQWYTLASPLQGVVAGDFYTDGEVTGTDNVAGTENQEYFTDITFDGKIDGKDSDANNATIKNSRFSPSVYQRGWKGTTNMVTTGKPNNVAVIGNWSAVYNNVEEKYEPGNGFSLKVLDMPKVNDTEATTAIFRLPKADGEYYYYDATTNNTSGTAVSIDGRDNTDFKAGQLHTNKLKGTDNEITVQLTKNGESNYYLIGNPFMAHLDAAKFFSENSNVLQQKYWKVTNNVQNVAASDGSDWASTEGTDIPTIAPLQSFFVQKTETADVSTTVTFTADMQTFAEKTSDEGTSTNTLTLTAKTADGKTSRAAIAYDMSADKGYASNEDAELFLDSNLSDVPTIYTVAGTMATSINRTSELYNIPVGIYGNSTEMVTLSFEGLKNFGSATLYDAEEKTETPLREGTTLTVPASTSGRYFLRAGAPTANEQIETSDIQIYTLSDSRVMVTSTTPLKNIRVYTINGALVRQTKSGFCSHELYLPNGIYVITAENANGQARTAKLNVN